MVMGEVNLTRGTGSTATVRAIARLQDRPRQNSKTGYLGPRQLLVMLGLCLEGMVSDLLLYSQTQLNAQSGGCGQKLIE